MNFECNGVKDVLNKLVLKQEEVIARLTYYGIVDH